MKYKLYRFSLDILKEILAPGVHAHPSYEVSEHGIPKDAEIVNVQAAWPYGGIDVLLRSESFPEIKHGDTIPAISPVIRLIT